MKTTAASKLGTIIKGTFVIVFAIIALATLYFGARGFNLYREALGATSLDDMAANIEGTPGYTSLDDLPRLYLDAVVGVEDRRYYAHPGVDVIATGRALVNDLKAGAIVEGGSTITQQLAKNQYFTQEQTVERKIAEMFMALTMERHFTKQKIIELYVNSIYFGDGYHSVRAASEGYFGCAPADLTDYESALLAGIPNAPSAYAPTINPDLATARQHQVLEKMVACDALTSVEAQRIATSDTIASALSDAHASSALAFAA